MRIYKIFSGLFAVSISIILLLFLIEVGANYYLWNVASEDQFNYYASINQLRERYGQDFLVSTKPKDRKSTSVMPHPYLGFTGRPNWENDRGNRQNALGFRGEEVSYDKPDGVYRIVAIGDSTTYGSSVDYKEAYPYALQKYLNQNGYDNIEVINAGVPAYTSYETLMMLQFRILDLDPDLIIVYQGSTDIHARLVWPPESYIGDNTGFRAPFVQDITMPPIWEYSTALRMIGLEMGWTTPQSDLEWIRWRRAKTVVGQEYRRQYSDGTYPSGFFTEVPAMEVLEANPPIYFERNIRMMVAIAQAYNIDILFSTFVVSTEFDSPHSASEVYRKGLEEHNEVTRRVARETNSYLIDLVPLFPNDKKFFTDGRHFTKAGNELRGQMIGDYIIDNILEANP